MRDLYCLLTMLALGSFLSFGCRTTNTTAKSSSAVPETAVLAQAPSSTAPTQTKPISESKPAVKDNTMGATAPVSEDMFRADAELEFEAKRPEAGIDTTISAEAIADDDEATPAACEGQGTCARGDTDKAELQVTSNVPGAQVMIDDILVGESGDQIDVTPGQSRVKVEAPGYEAKTIDVSIKQGETLKVHVELGRGH